VHLQFKPGIGTCVKPLNAHLLQLTVDRLNRMTIRAHFDVVHTPGVRTHVRPAHRDQAHPRLRQDAGLISGALGGCIPQQPRPGGQAIRTPPVPPVRGGFGGASGRAPLRAASARVRARHPGGRPDAHAIQRTSPVSPRTTRSIRARAPSDSAGRAHDGRLAGGGYR
jgi:hypothetical protein